MQANISALHKEKEIIEYAERKAKNIIDQAQVKVNNMEDEVKENYETALKNKQSRKR